MEKGHELLHVILPSIGINAIGGSRDGSLFAYGMQNGCVELRDLRYPYSLSTSQNMR